MVCGAIAGEQQENMSKCKLWVNLKEGGTGHLCWVPCREEANTHNKQSQVNVVVADATLKISFLFWVAYPLQVEKPPVLEEGW